MTVSRAEIAFEWDVFYGDFCDRICVRMQLEPKDAMLGYKFEVDPKKSLIQLPLNNPATFNTMLDKIKSRMARARTRTVFLKIYDLVCFIWMVEVLTDLPTGRPDENDPEEETSY